MQKFGLVTVFLFLVLVHLMNSGEGLKCYVCRSDTDKNCTSDDLSESHSKECPSVNGKDALVCRKIHQKLKFKKEENYTTIRECGYHEGHLECYFFRDVKLADQETCECKKDNCNRGRSFGPDVGTIVFMFAFVTDRYYLNTI